jgi:hypothetical protein
LTALYGTSDEAVALLLSVDAYDRATASSFLEFRDDLPQIVAAVRRTPPAFELGMVTALDNLSADQTKLLPWLAAIPDWALDWWIFIAKRLHGALTGFSLKHLAAINARKARGIERPFIDDLLQFPAWK